MDGVSFIKPRDEEPADWVLLCLIWGMVVVVLFV
jgi:hypothetical protein